MKRQDISILVINRIIRPDEEIHGGLDTHIKALQARGYKVTEDARVRGDLSQYDIIVAHPSWSDISLLEEFHQKNSQVPLLICSGFGAGERNAKVAGFRKDKYNTHYAVSPDIQDFLRLIKSFTSEIYQGKLKL